MHELRANLKAEEQGGPARLIASKRGKSRADVGLGSLTAIPVQREQSRSFNQRSEDRQADLVDSATVHFRRRRFDVRVINVSSAGVMIETEVEPNIGEGMEIQFAECNRTKGVVRWVRGGRIGLEFVDQTIILASLKVKQQIFGETGQSCDTGSGDADGDSGSQQRPMYARARRHGLTWTGTLYWSYEAFSVRLRNVSSDGAMLEGDCDLPAGAKVRLNLAQTGTVSGEVRWCQGGQVGVQFDEKFDLKTLAHSKPDGPLYGAGKPVYPTPPPAKTERRSIWKMRF